MLIIALICLALCLAVLLLIVFNLVGQLFRFAEVDQVDGLSVEDSMLQLSNSRRLNPILERGGMICLPLMTWTHRTRLSRTLAQAGVNSLEHQHFFFIQMMSSLIFILSATFILTNLLEMNIFAFSHLGWLIFSGISGFLIPGVSLNSKGKKRQEEILRTLPFFMDMLSLGLNAGMSLQSSLQLTLNHLDDGPLKREWSKYIFDVRSGFSRAHALRQLSDRIDISVVRQFVAALIQGESMGLSLTRTVLEYGKQLRTMRLLRAEKLAFQAPVKMLFPLAFCIFPCTFLILGFPVVAQALGLS
ncbi:MAG TPA: hypothetical protein DDY24_06835 [Alcaligenaceae bacterium]|nr:hypothetical protein [Alcaligenaceae bacterium]